MANYVTEVELGAPASITAAPWVSARRVASGAPALNVAATLSADGGISVQRYLDPQGKIAAGPPVIAPMTGGAPINLNIADGLVYQSYTVSLMVTTGSGHLTKFMVAELVGAGLSSAELTYGSYPVDATTGLFVDSVAGNDTNPGTQALPFKTLGHIAWTPNLKINLKRGSYFRESIVQTAINCTLTDYGSGKMPIIDCCDIIPNTGWTQPDSSGAPNVWAKTITTPAILNANFASIWESGLRLLSVASRATCNTTPGSFAVTGSSVGNYGPTSITFEINSASGTKNPNTNGLVYEAPTRPYGVSTGTGWTVENMHTKRNGHNNGSMILNRGCVATGCLVEDGVKHNMLVAANCVLSSCYAWKADYPVAGRDGWIGFVAFDLGLPAGSTGTFNNCFAIVDQATITWMLANNPTGGMTGFDAHTDAATQWSAINYNNCTAEFCAVGFGASDTVNTNINAVHTASCSLGISLTGYVGGGATMIDPWIQQSGGINMIRHLDLNGLVGSTFTITGARLYGTGTNNDAMIYSSGDCTLNISRSALASLDHTAYKFGVRKIGKNLNMTGMVHVGDYSGFGDAFDANDTPLALDYNAYSPMDMQYLGTQYAGAAAYFAVVHPLGLENHSVALAGDQHGIFINAAAGDFTLGVGSGLDPAVFGVANPGLTYAPIPTPTELGNM